MSRSSRGRKHSAWGLLALLLATLAACGSPADSTQRASRDDPSRNEAADSAIEETQPKFPLPAIAWSRFLNSDQSVAYAGNQACASCHEAEHASYMQTSHSRALAKLDPRHEPPDTYFQHEASGRWYRVYRDGERMHHRESIRADDGQEVVLADFAIDYVIGSGNHSRTYLINTDGFMIESPITWYTARDGWAMSPGYEDDPNQPGFARPARFECLLCHSGGVESIGGSTHRLKIHQEAIGCERCHGPGALHVERQEAGRGTADDFTIVHPDKLDREQNIAVCAQCHLASAAQVNVRGRQPDQFRPGLKINDFQVNYILESADESMTVVGHVEQMQLSRCFTQSALLTCVTCHDPHQPLPSESRIDFYRQKCLSCHETQGCGLEEAERILRDAQDNCVHCHMPTSDTDIPHFAFTHHRIGLHSDGADAQSEPHDNGVGQLVPLVDVSHLPQVEQDRCFGLGYLQLSESDSEPSNSAAYRARAVNLLEDVLARGVEDPDVHAALARVYWRAAPQKSIEHARTALSTETISPETRRDAMSVLGASYFDTGNIPRALKTLEQFVQLERDAESWMLLAVCYQRSGNLPAALDAAKQAADIEPDRPDFQVLVAQLYQLSGQPQLAAKHEERARQLQEVEAKRPAKN